MLKNRLFTSVFMMLAMAGMSAAAYNGTPTAKANFATETINSKTCYKIGSAEDLYGFAAIVNGTNGNTAEPTACGVLTADIVVNEHVLKNASGQSCVNTTNSPGSFNANGCNKTEYLSTLYTWTPIGVYYTGNVHPFQGTFDGQGHTISGLFDNNTSSAAKYTGLFGYVSGTNATVSIKNVGVEDSYFRVDSYAGGIVGMVYNGSGELNIENVYSGSVLYIKGEGEVGGLVGYVKDWTLNITNAYNSGSIFGTSGTTKASYVAGLVGCISSSARVNIKNAFNNGNLNGYAPLVNSNATVTNSFYLGNQSQGGYGVNKSSEDFSNGSVFAALRSAEGGSVWHQYQGDSYPSFAEKEGKTPFVPHSATLHYSSTESETIYFVEGSTASLPTVDKSGNPVLGWYDNEGLTGTKYTEIPASANSDLTLYPKVMKLVDGCFEISDADMLYAFAAAVNNGNAIACGKLTANIVVNQNVLGANNANVNVDGSYNNAQAASTFRVWTPIGNSTNKFQGAFNGQGHTISGLYFNDPSSSDVGLFSSVFGEPKPVTIENVGLVDSYFRGNSSVGGLVGNANGLVTIKNSFNAGSINAQGEIFGGLVGYSWQSTADVVKLTISNSYNTGSLNGGSFGGGLVGSAVDLIISNSYNTGSVTVSKTDLENGVVNCVGGFAASADKVTITNSYNYGSVSSPDGARKDDFVTSFNDGSTVTNSFFISECDFEGNGATKMSSTQFSDGTVFAALRSAEDGEVWRQYSGDVYPTFVEKTGTDAPSPMHVAVLHYSETDSVVIAYTEGSALTLPTTLSDGSIVVGDWYKSDDLSGDAYTKIAATENGDLNFYAKAMVKDAKDNCYEIADADMLFKFADLVNNQNKTYGASCAKLTADIVVNELVLTTASGESKVNAEGEYIGVDTDFRVWTPIGANVDGKQNSFSGSFDGQGHTISGLYLNKEIRGNEYSALFGIVGGEASVKNVGIEDSYFAAQRYVGGIVGLSVADMLKIENCYNDATLYGVNGIAGLVGEINGDTQSLTIENSYNSGTIKYDLSSGGRPSATGALVGDAGNHANVINCYYLVQEGVESEFGSAASSTAFSDGTVAILLHGSDDESVWGQKVGTDNHPNFYKGIDGSGNPKTEGSGVIEYQQGETGPSPFTVTLHYGEDSDSTFEYYPGIETLLPTEDKNGKTIIGWTTSDDGSGDIITAIPTTATSALALYPKADFVPNDKGYYEITTVEQLYRFAEIVNTCKGSCNFKAKLENDITVNENVLNADGSLNSADASKFVAWTPIGTFGNPFEGVFDGQGHIISGLYFNESDEELLTTGSVGLFGLVDGSTTSISNVGVEDSYFGTVWEYAGIGGIVGFIDEKSIVNIENAYSKATVVGANVVSYAGGLVGDFCGSSLTITNSYHAGVVEGASGGGDYGFGGLVGENYGTISISNSFNYGTVQCSGEYCGALIGVDYAETTVSNSYYLGDAANGGYGEFKSASDFENGTVLAALRADEDAYVWVQAPGDKYPTIDINASKNANTIVLDWTNAAGSTTLAAAGYTDGAMVIVKSGKKFYADGAIYEGILSADQVAAIGSNKLYPISGVELEVVEGKLVATLDGMDRADGEIAPSVMIPTDVLVDKVVYKRDISAGVFRTVMLPFSISLDKVSGHSFYKFSRMAENDNGRRYVAKVSTVTGTLNANTPYIMVATAAATEIVFENEGQKLTLNTTTGSKETVSGEWRMKGVYEYKKWEELDPEIGDAYVFAGRTQDGVKIGQFARLGSGASLQPMRMYLLRSSSQSPSGRPGQSGKNGFARISPESIEIEIDDSDIGEIVEETTVVKHITVVPSTVQQNRWFDMKGRALNGKPTAKGTYYYNGKRIVIR